jgi:hypothetical protein
MDKLSIGSAKNNPTNKFTQNILKSIVGTEKAHNAFASISMVAIPNNNISLEGKPLV